MRKILSVVALLALALGISTVALTFPERRALPIDPDKLTLEQQRYCDRVDQWRREAMLDVDVPVRLGEPDTKGVYSLWCTQR